MNWQAWIDMIDQSMIAVVTIGTIPIVSRMVYNISKILKKPEEKCNTHLQIGDVVRMEITDPMVIEEIEVLEERHDLIHQKVIAYGHKLDMLNTSLDGEFNPDRIARLELEIVNVELNINKLKQQADELSMKIDKIQATKGTPVEILRV